MNSQQNLDRVPKTKIVCTLGPATESEEKIEELILAGMNIARLNFSHGDLEAHTTAFERVRKTSDKLNMPVGIMVDVPGPKYRTGPTIPGVLNVKDGDDITLTSTDLIGDSHIISVTPSGIHRDATVGRPILLDDGLLEFIVTEIDGEDVNCRIIVGGRITERRGVATPGKAPSQPFPDEKAKTALKFAGNMKADFVALSTVTKADDVTRARDLLSEYQADGYIISKIERAEALDNLDSIIEVSDSIMVARGDMGVEVPLSRVPIIQKDLITRCNLAGKPVITATQMLESMIENARPTRAEVSDISYAVTLGADAVMLSAESATGSFPVESVDMMDRILRQTEAYLWQHGEYDSGLCTSDKAPVPLSDAMANASNSLARDLMAHAVIVISQGGMSAATMSSARPAAPVVAISSRVYTCRKMALMWSIIPVLVEESDMGNHHALAKKIAKQLDLANPGDTVLLVKGFHQDPELNCPSVTVVTV